MTLRQIFVYITSLTALILMPNLTIGQDNNFVRDQKLEKDLYNFLITRVSDYLIDSMGNHSPAYKLGEDLITTRNLKTDSIIGDKQVVGLYAARFACMDCGSDLELYFQFKDHREYLTITSKTDPFDLISKIKEFFKIYPNEFNDLEKVKTIKEAMDILETHFTHPFNWVEYQEKK